MSDYNSTKHVTESKFNSTSTYGISISSRLTGQEQKQFDSKRFMPYIYNPT